MPLKLESVTRGDLTEVGRSTRAKKSFICDAAKVWNKAHEKIRASKTLTTAKKAIRDLGLAIQSKLMLEIC
jgi:hypothetical protein